MAKIVVIANCQCLPIAHCLALGLTGSNVEFIDVNFIDRDKQKIERLTTSPSDYVFSIPLSEQWGPISSAVLRGLYGRNLITFTNIFFDGLHPDISYVGGMGSRLHGVLAEYHSKIILYSFLSGRNKADCNQLFSDTDITKFGYDSAFAQSANTLLARDEECDVKFAQDFIDMTKLKISLYTSNHVADSVYVRLCERLCDFIDLSYIAYPDTYLTNSLSTNIIWPIYEQIADFNRLAYRTPQTFIAPSNGNGRSLGLDEVISRCYHLYSTIPDENFRAMIESIPFYARFQGAIG